MNRTTRTRRRWKSPKRLLIAKVIPWFIGAMCVIANTIALISVAGRAR